MLFDMKDDARPASVVQLILLRGGMCAREAILNRLLCMFIAVSLFAAFFLSFL